MTTIGSASHIEKLDEIHRLRDEIDRLRTANAAAAEEFDANVDRLKACEHIADGDEGWERLRNECPSTAAVARLRDSHAAMLDALEGVVRVADRKTIEFDAARAAIARARGDAPSEA